jgi:Tfp pilus assembly protein PilN
MINLLPPETKKAYFYAQQNQKLIKWVVALVVGLIGLGAIGTFGWVSMHQAITTYSTKVATGENLLTKEHQATINQQVQAISNDFTLVVKVLSQEVVFSKLLTDMAAAMPAGTNLTNLTITDTAAGTGLDIKADATDYTTASQIQINLADPANGMFSKADLVSITCSNAPQNPAYPCDVTLRAEFAKNNQFLFINQGSTQ